MLSYRLWQTAVASPGGRGKKLAIKQPILQALSWLGTNVNRRDARTGAASGNSLGRMGGLTCRQSPLGQTGTGGYRAGGQTEMLSLARPDFDQPIDAQSLRHAQSVPLNVGQGYAVPSLKNPVDFT